VIVLATHIWVWWVDQNARLTPSQLRHLQDNQAGGLGISAISCWEVAKLIEVGRLELLRTVNNWIRVALWLRRASTNAHC
jgi:PIN domain nuclease of toxin-antitoxin system